MSEVVAILTERPEAGSQGRRRCVLRVLVVGEEPGGVAGEPGDGGVEGGGDAREEGGEAQVVVWVSQRHDADGYWNLADGALAKVELYWNFARG